MSTVEMRFSGADWIRRQPAWRDRQVSEFGELVADLLGFAFEGLYHIDGVGKAAWDDASHIVVNVYGSLSTFDDSRLTWLTLACHRLAIRMEIRPKSRYELLLIFSLCDGGEDRPFVGKHRSIGEAITLFNNEFKVVNRK